jgi:DNA polymerase I-like protein with 3'-5' exonuclease and polymerase domains
MQSNVGDCYAFLFLYYCYDRNSYECLEDDATVSIVSQAMQECMEGAVSLSVPLTVNLAVGKTWASLA